MQKNNQVKTRAVPVIIVGTGHHFQRNIMPTVIRLQEEGLIKVLITIDILNRSEKGYFDNVAHIKRNNKPIHEQLREFKKEDPLVILGHTNSLHAKDAFDLLSHGFRVIIEKPYALNSKSLHKFLKIAKKNRCVLLEYYLTMKSTALLWGYGEIDRKSFYVTDWLIKASPILTKYAPSLEGFRNKLPEIIGTIQRVEVEVLEGEGETGTLEGRGIDTIDMKFGGGMIQDMGTHALVPLLALEKIIGSFPDKNGFSVRIAYSKEYTHMVKRRFAIPVGRIGETYVESMFTTSKNIPVTICFGKYVFGDRNRRGVRLFGSMGEAYLDMNDCTLYVNGETVIGVDKSYYHTVRAAIAEISGEPLFHFNSVKVAAKAQDLVFDLQRIAYKNKEKVYYRSGIDPKQIFKEGGVMLNEGDIRSEDSYNVWLQLLGKELHNFFPVKHRKETMCPGCSAGEIDSEFVKLGFIYRRCKNCFSLYASPRPSERDIDEFYRASKAMKFYGERVFRPALESRYEHQIIPLSNWVKEITAKYAPKAKNILDFMPKFYSSWAEIPKRAQRKISLLDPVHLFKNPPASKSISLGEAIQKKYDVITAFDVLDHRSDPEKTIKDFSEMCVKNGLLLLTLNSGSGFEYQVLGRDAHRLVPPTKLNLLTTETIEQILQKNNFKIIHFSTPGKLDVDIVLKTLQDDHFVHVPRFISYILKERGPSVRESLQQFLQLNNLSSFLRVAARKK